MQCSVAVERSSISRASCAPRNPVAPVSRIARASSSDRVVLRSHRPRGRTSCGRTLSANMRSNGSSIGGRDGTSASARRRASERIGAFEEQVRRQLAAQRLFQRRRQLDHRQRIETEQREGVVGPAVTPVDRKQRAVTAEIVVSRLATVMTPPRRQHASSCPASPPRTASPAEKSRSAQIRCNLPLVVFGSVPAGTSATARSWTLCVAATAWRMASIVRENVRPTLGSFGGPARIDLGEQCDASSPSVSIATAAQPPGRIDGCALSAVVLEVVRIVLQTADDDDVLEPAGDEELSVAQQSQVAGAEERAFAVRQAGAERLARFLRPPPIAGRHAASRNQISPTAPSSLCSRLTGSTIRTRMSSTGDPRRRARPSWSLGRVMEGDVRPGGAARHEQRRFRQAVSRPERRPAEAAFAERAMKRLERRAAHRFGSVEGRSPRAQVKAARSSSPTRRTHRS